MLQSLILLLLLLLILLLKYYYCGCRMNWRMWWALVICGSLNIDSGVRWPNALDAANPAPPLLPLLADDDDHRP